MNGIRWSVLLMLAFSCSEYDLTGHMDGHDNGLGGEDGDGADGDVVVYENLGWVTGRICAPSGDYYIANAKVSVTFDGVVFSTMTDADGFFTLEAPAGDYDALVEKGSFSTTFSVLIVEDETTVLSVEECLRDDLSIAVLQGDYDAVENFLDDLGHSYQFFEPGFSSEYAELLRDPSQMEQFDIIIINCTVEDDWFNYASEIGGNLRDFVENGGSVYASDYSYYFIEAAFPEAATFVGEDLIPGDGWGSGESGETLANIVDPGLQTAMGKTQAHIIFNTAWVRVDSTPFEVLIDDDDLGPLTVRYRHSSGGTVLYTGFHNEYQASEDMIALVQEFIYSL